MMVFNDISFFCASMIVASTNTYCKATIGPLGSCLWNTLIFPLVKSFPTIIEIYHYRITVARVWSVTRIYKNITYLSDRKMAGRGMSHYDTRRRAREVLPLEAEAEQWWSLSHRLGYLLRYHDRRGLWTHRIHQSHPCPSLYASCRDPRNGTLVSHELDNLQWAIEVHSGCCASSVSDLG